MKFIEHMTIDKVLETRRHVVHDTGLQPGFKMRVLDKAENNHFQKERENVSLVTRSPKL